jgi:hypothetical protein
LPGDLIRPLKRAEGVQYAQNVAHRRAFTSPLWVVGHKAQGEGHLLQAPQRRQQRRQQRQDKVELRLLFSIE